MQENCMKLHIKEALERELRRRKQCRQGKFCHYARRANNILSSWSSLNRTKQAIKTLVDKGKQTYTSKTFQPRPCLCAMGTPNSATIYKD